VTGSRLSSNNFNLEMLALPVFFQITFTLIPIDVLNPKRKKSVGPFLKD
jgi:hypothetical protein